MVKHQQPVPPAGAAEPELLRKPERGAERSAADRPVRSLLFDNQTATLGATAVAESAPFTLLGIGLIGFGIIRRRRAELQ